MKFSDLDSSSVAIIFILGVIGSLALSYYIIKEAVKSGILSAWSKIGTPEEVKEAALTPKEE